MMGFNLLLAVALSAGNAEFDNVANIEAAHIASQRVVQRLVVNGPKVGTLSEAMLADPKTFQTSDAAKKECGVLYSKAIEKAFNEEIQQIRKQLTLPDNVEIIITDQQMALFAKAFPDYFAKERKNAVERQSQTLVSTVRPTEKEFETMDEGALRKVLTERLATCQKQVVFDENRAYISERMVSPILEGAHKARTRQQNYVKRVNSSHYAPDLVKRDITESLQNQVSRAWQGSQPDQGWGVFPSVLEKDIPAVVESKTLSHWIRGVESTRVEVTEDMVLKMIIANSQEHYSAQKSEKAFTLEMSSQVVKSSQARVLESIPQAEREQVQAFWKQHEQTAEITRAVNRLVKQELIPQWRKHRDALIEKDAIQRWPTLVDRTWFPKSEIADKLLSRSDFQAAVKGWREIKEIDDLKPSAKTSFPELEEAKNVADQRVLTAFELARNALQAQMNIVSRVVPDVLEMFKGEQNKFFGRKVSLEVIVKQLTSATEKLWDEEREKVLWPKGDKPSNAAEQHTELFPSVKRKIELEAKSILEQIIPPPPEETPPPPEELAYTISVKRSGGKVTVQLLKGSDAIVDREIDAARAPFDAALKEVSEKLGRDILKLK